MCLLNYNKNRNKYKHLTYTERAMIETWYNSDKKSKKEIAKLLHKSERTIRREINRGKVIIRGYLWEEVEEYSARVAQNKYEYEMTSKGPALKLDQDISLVKHIEREIIDNKKSPEVIVCQLKEYGFDINITSRTIRNAIKAGIIFEEIDSEKIIYKKEYKSKNKEKRVSKMIPAEKSIEYRCKEANNRSEYGHWEGDLVIGKRKKESVLLTFTERMTREEIIIKIKEKNNDYAVKAINTLERKLEKEFIQNLKQ